MFYNLDFYELLRDVDRGELDPCLDREENKERIRIAAKKWNNRFGSEADVIKQLLSEAAAVFSDEGNYRRFRTWYVQGKVGGFLEGAAGGGVILREKIRAAELQAEACGADPDQVQEIVQRMNLVVLEKAPRPSSRGWQVYSAVMTVVALLLVFLWWRAGGSTTGAAPTPAESEIERSLQAVSTPAPSYMELQRQVPRLLARSADPNWKERIGQRLGVVKAYCLRMAGESANERDARDWLELAARIDPQDAEIRRRLTQSGQ